MLRKVQARLLMETSEDVTVMVSATISLLGLLKVGEHSVIDDENANVVSAVKKL